MHAMNNMMIPIPVPLCCITQNKYSIYNKANGVLGFWGFGEIGRAHD